MLYCLPPLKCPKRRNGRMTFICDHCGAPFEHYKSRAIRGKRHFCTNECRKAARTGSGNSNWRGGMVQRTCLSCGIEFEVLKANANRGYGKYCSFSCRKAHLRIYPSNEIRVKELRRRRESRERAAVKLHGHHTHSEWMAVVEAAGNRCVKCGATERIEKDHIIPLSKGGSDLIDNIQPLCKSCNCRKWARMP